MTLAVTHSFVSAVPDEGNPGEIEPSHWNAAHVVSGSLDPAALTGPVSNTNYRYVQPTTGSTVTLNNSDYQVIIDAATGLASLAILACPNPVDGQIVEVITNKNISGLSFVPNSGQTVVNGPTLLSTGGFFKAEYRAANTSWYCTQEIVFVPANANLTFYVSTTGSDSNPGTAANPFATLQHAINVCAAYDWQNTFFPTINIADGTYSGGGGPSLVALIDTMWNLTASNIRITGNTGAPSNVVMNETGGVIQIYNNAATIKGMQFNGGGNATLYAANNGTFAVANLIFAATVNANTTPFYAQGTAALIAIIGNVNVTSTSLQYLGFGSPGSVEFFAGTLVLPVALTITAAFFEADGPSSIIIAPSSITNAGGVTGVALIASDEANIATPTGEISAIPGTNTGTIDGSVIINGNNKFGLYMNIHSGIPTTSQIPSGCWGVWKDTSGGGVYAAANDAGTIKKVALV